MATCEDKTRLDSVFTVLCEHGALRGACSLCPKAPPPRTKQEAALKLNAVLKNLKMKRDNDPHRREEAAPASEPVSEGEDEDGITTLEPWQARGHIEC